ncbi:hypothetical protein [Streptomyces anulatus]|nr:hypothetical protein [Streptomyces anulatus]
MTALPVVVQAAIVAGVLAGIMLVLVVLARTERHRRPRGPGRRR